MAARHRAAFFYLPKGGFFLRVDCVFYCFFCSVVVDRCVVELSVAGVVVPSGFTVAGVDCFVSV